MVGQLQDIDAIVNGDGRLAVVHDGSIKALQLRLDGINWMYFRHFKRNLTLRAIGQSDGCRQGIVFIYLFVDTEDLGFLVKEIDGDVGVALEDTGLAHILQGKARGREVGHRAVFELNAGIGDVGRLADDANAAGTNMGDG